MDLEAQLISIFYNSPYQFMEICLSCSDDREIMHPFCQYVSLSISKHINRDLSKKEDDLLNSLFERYGVIDITSLVPIKQEEITVRSFEKSLKNYFDHAYDLFKKDQLNNPSKDHRAFIEYIKNVSNNIDFSKKDRKSKGIKFDIESHETFIDFIVNFEGKKYNIKDDIIINLSPEAFVHILMGHVNAFLAPRRGLSIPFTNVSSCEALILLIDNVIEYIKQDLITHYTSSKEHFEVNFELNQIKFKIHIKTKKRI